MGKRAQFHEQLTPLGDGFSWRQWAADALRLNLSMGALLIGSLRYNAEMWVNDYPPDIRERFGPRNERATKQALLVAVPFFLILIGGVLYSNRKMRIQNHGRLSQVDAFFNAYLLFLSFWVFDLTILDWLFFVKIKPDFIVLPGTEEMAGYDDYGFHLWVALPALVWMAIPALVIAWFTAGNRGRTRNTLW